MRDTQPHELNFCFGLKIHWKNGQTTEIRLGQGSTMSRNNWWIGSRAIEATAGRATIQAGDEKLQLTGYNSTANAASLEADEAGAQATIPPALVWLIKLVGQQVAKELVKLILANVNSFKITK